jgi:hypothetical protein
VDGIASCALHDVATLRQLSYVMSYKKYVGNDVPSTVGNNKDDEKSVRTSGSYMALKCNCHLYYANSGGDVAL